MYFLELGSLHRAHPIECSMMDQIRHEVANFKSPVGDFVPLDELDQRLAAEWASVNNDLVTLGVSPTRPETGYGYLKMGQEKSIQDIQCYSVDKFLEKPSQEKAESFLKEGNYLWNGGMFAWSVKSILSEFANPCPTLVMTARNVFLQC